LKIDTNLDSAEEINAITKVKEGGQIGWSDRVVRLLGIIKGKPDVTRKELSEALKINPSAVQKHMERLKAEGVISREGSDKKGVWKVTDGVND